MAARPSRPRRRLRPPDDRRSAGLVAAGLGWGLLAGSSLLVGAVIALRFRISLRAIGLVMAFGGGVLISAIAFDLVQEAVDTQSAQWPVLVGICAGCPTFFSGDWLSTASAARTGRTPAA